MRGGAIAGHLIGMSKKLKPTLRVHASMDSYGAVPGSLEKDQEMKFVKEDLARCKSECAAIEKALEEWVPEDVAARAEKSLRSELKMKHARMAELKAKLDAYEEEDEDEEEEEEED